MLTLPFTLLAILLGVAQVSGAPAAASSSLSNAPTKTSSVASSTVTDAAPSDRDYASTEPNFPLWGQDDQNANPQPIRGAKGLPVLAEENKQIDIQNPDLLAPPSTDRGNMPNAKWPFSLSHNRLLDGGWVRQQNVNAMPIATAMAGVNMRLEAGAIRELHWHRTSEWAYVLKGYTQITAVDAKGRNFISTVGPGDLWYFPPGIPHSLQATNQTEGGSEFLLVFPDGQFSADDTFQLTEWMAHVPSEVIAKNFQVDAKEFNRIPAEQLFIFPGKSPNPNGKVPESPQGTVPEPYSFEFSKVKATEASGGSVRIADASTFKISKQIAVAEVTVEPGALRELHWHPTEDEWSFFLEGTARVTIFASTGNHQTFDYRAGDIGYVPFSMGHYVENTGNTTLKFLEIFNTDTFEDVSLNQWLALTPPELVKAHLQLSDNAVGKLSKTKPVVIGPDTD